MGKTGKVIAVCISENKGTQKTEVPSIRLVPEWGIEGDAHAGKWHRQVSLLALERSKHSGKEALMWISERSARIS